ncbi:Bor/Iss family lipoprotein [Pseudoteredinibacter isoporae]|uniref:Lipoprotein n=1 Tax=Pseudoteredinibacter isoporae TaxID=570281 RepID=A0A7X0JTV0_9GAMM|nr:hypothetical protein [Pseudoteredinibacter isoporae]MBB6522037.1 hypothetical protein [Pseudoteredinibacter isoporae]NHO87573.1 hypothetical protein [Pseudoteredinibacter isoporae]NIB24096.1 hypothetical protein [Pseudoteredinibacter isoporae]
MKKLNFLVITLTSLVALSACSRIHFVQYEQENNEQEEKRWHHTTLNGLVELSPPLNLSEVCRGKAWNHVTTETSFGNWAVSLLNPAIPYLVLYSPRTNRIQCYQVPIENSNDKDV